MSRIPDPVYVGFDLRLARMARFFIRHRRVGLILQVLVGALCLYAIAGLHLRDDPNAWPPKSDPLVQLNRKIMASFGGGNSVSIEVEADKGSIYRLENLATIKTITDKLPLINGCIPYAVRSLSSLSSQRYAFLNKGTPDETMVIAPIMPQLPTSDKEVEAVRAAVEANPLLNGVLVSKDGKAALILADFRSEVPSHAKLKLATTDPIAIYRDVTKLLDSQRRPGITLRAAGTPITIGWVNSVGLRYIGLAFGFFIVTIAAILWYGFRNISGIILPMRVALLGTLMGFGVYRLLFGPVLYSASALLAPFIIVAAGACHSVQFLNRFFYEEYPRFRNTEVAIVSTFVSRLRPMLVSLLCDVVPFAIMAAIPFENVKALGIVTALGLLSLTVDEFVLMIPALSSIALHELEGARERKEKAKESGRLDRLVADGVRRLIDGRGLAWSILALCVILVGAGAWVDMKTVVGQDNTYAIHNYLTRSWKTNPIYQMERQITERFGGVYPMTVLIGSGPGQQKELEDPRVVKAIDELSGFLREQPHIGSVSDLAFPIKLTNDFIHGEDPSNLRVPDTSYALGQILYSMANDSPGVYAWLVTNDFSASLITAYADSTSPTVVNALMTDAQRKADQLFAGLPVQVGVAGGSVGIAAAFNRDTRYWLVAAALLGLAGTFVLAIPFVRSSLLSFIFLLPLVMAMVLSLASMALCGIELNSNAIAALAIASGVGIDSEVYLLFRVREEFAAVGDFRTALVQGYVNIRRALLVSNGALILGCWALIPAPLYIGYVGFGMGVVLLLCFVLSAILSPLVWSRFGERVVAGVSADSTAPPQRRVAV